STVLTDAPERRRAGREIGSFASTQKKIAEARFFLDLLTKEERRIFGDKNPFDYYLSAFLSSARTVDWRLRHEQAAIYPIWRSAWDASLTAEDNALIKFMVDDRNQEVHESGSLRTVGQEGIGLPIGESHIDGCIVTTSGPPGMPPTVAYKPTYSFTVGGTERNATDAAAAFLALLQRMVEKFEADHP
ncbi:MAG: hypothetical protein ACRECZ_06840, partial [Methylocella sp.]